MKRMTAAVLITGLVAGLGACESATGPAGEATVEVAAHGDATGETGSSTSSSEGSASQSSTSRAEGTVDFRARVWVRTETNRWVELTQGTAKHFRVDASGRQGAQTFHTARADARAYNRVRIEFEEVRANVTGGIVIGTNWLSGEVRVDFGPGGKAYVERSVQMDARSASGATLVIDLNSGQWLSKANSRNRTASRAEFESAVRVLVK